MRVILGSSSPRRKHILGTIYHAEFEIAHPDIDETPLQGEKPEAHCIRLAESKARNCEPLLATDTVIICADTIVALNDTIYGKPKNHLEAVRFLTELEGKTHRVLTGFSLITNYASPRIFTNICRTDVTFHSLSTGKIEEYLLSIDYLDKAGSYAIQDNGAHIISRIDGSLSNVIGFPVRLFYSLLSEANLLAALYN